MNEFLLIEPIKSTPFPPLGLMKISSMLKNKYKNVKVCCSIGKAFKNDINDPEKIYITSLFTWDLNKVNKIIYYCH